MAQCTKRPLTSTKGTSRSAKIFAPTLSARQTAAAFSRSRCANKTAAAKRLTPKTSGWAVKATSLTTSGHQA